MTPEERKERIVRYLRQMDKPRIRYSPATFCPHGTQMSEACYTFRTPRGMYFARSFRKICLLASGR